MARVESGERIRKLITRVGAPLLVASGIVFSPTHQARATEQVCDPAPAITTKDFELTQCNGFVEMYLTKPTKDPEPALREAAEILTANNCQQSRDNYTTPQDNRIFGFAVPYRCLYPPPPSSSAPRPTWT